MAKIVQEFREFVARGNVIDLAVGIIIGAAFGKIVNSLVNDIIMPPIGMALKSVNFNSLFFALDGKTYASLADAQQAGAPVIASGSFINICIEFLIVAVCVFLLVKAVNRLKRKEAAAAAQPAGPTKTEALLEEIRDALRKRQ